MKPDIEEARALAKRVEAAGNLWLPYDSGRYAYHTDIPLSDNPWDEPPNMDAYAFMQWARGWLHEANKE